MFQQRRDHSGGKFEIVFMTNSVAKSRDKFYYIINTPWHATNIANYTISIITCSQYHEKYFSLDVTYTFNC